MKHLLIVIALLFSFQACASVTTILDLTGATTNQTSTAAKTGTVYSVQCDVSGAAFDIDVQLQASVDNTLFTNLTQFTANITSAQSLMFDVSGTSHKQARIVVTRNSGTYNITCKLKN